MENIGKPFFSKGHFFWCADMLACRCAFFRYATVAVFASAAALFLWFVSADASLAIYTDIPHIVGDVLSYVLSALIILIAGRLPDGHWVKRAANKVISILLAISAVFVIFEAYERYNLPDYPFDSYRSALGGVVACAINIACWFVLKSDRNPDLLDDGLVLHAESDAAHAGSVALATFMVPFAVQVSAFAGLPARPIHFDFLISGVLFLYMFLLALAIWKNKGCGHSHNRHPAVRLLLRLRGKKGDAHAHHHHDGEACKGGDHHH